MGWHDVHNIYMYVYSGILFKHVIITCMSGNDPLSV